VRAVAAVPVVMAPVCVLLFSTFTAEIGVRPRWEPRRGVEPVAGRAGPAWARPEPAARVSRGDRPLSPVAGVRDEDLEDTYGFPRVGDRRHAGIDIHAPLGTPVVASLDGWVMNLREGGAGGLALHLLDRSGQYLLYYAHLDRYADGLWAGRAVRQGEVLGYVGYTGNADAGSPHLHFEVGRVAQPRSWWRFQPLNPYHFLTAELRLDGPGPGGRAAADP
jgi:peptidoglycan LD-endopeptidase LytH